MIDRAVLRDQYADGDRLAARQSLWRMRTGPSLQCTVIDLAALRGTETIVDVGCGNGTYLSELRRRGHTGPILGVDLSEGMARQSRVHAAAAIADAQALPLRDKTIDVGLSLHMLYHVPDVTLAVSELRRVLRPGGTAMIATNGPGHIAEPDQILATAASQVAGIDVNRDWVTLRFGPDEARDLLNTSFDEVELHELRDSVPVHDPAIITRYIASLPPESVGVRTGPLWTEILAAADELVTAHFATHKDFLVTSRVAVFRCR
jgi:ubiquinone/menaquinone biosynthesis C-methylase UbiE